MFSAYKFAPKEEKQFKQNSSDMRNSCSNLIIGESTLTIDSSSVSSNQNNNVILIIEKDYTHYIDYFFEKLENKLAVI